MPPRRWKRSAGLWLAACGTITACAPLRPNSPPSVAAPGAGTRPRVAPDATDPAEVVREAHNLERGRRHLAPLVLDARLCRAAQAHADDMVRRRKMSHRGGDGSSPFDRMKQAGYSFQAAAENVAYGQTSIAAVMTAWMHSSGHRRNILGAYRELGVGHATDSAGVPYWCVTFGTPDPTNSADRR